MSTKSYTIIGDSISSYVPTGQGKHLCWSLITQERDVIFKNLSQPGAQLGHTGYYNGPGFIDTLNRLSGWGAINTNGLIVQAGINDYNFGTSWTDYVDSLNQLISWTAQQNKPLMLLDILWSGSESLPNQAGKTLADYRTHRYFMGLNHPHVKFCGRPPAFDQLNPPLYDDGHPNIAGHRELANWIETEATTHGFF